MTTYTCRIDTPLGTLTASAAAGDLTGLWFVGQKHYPTQVNDWLDNCAKDPEEVLFASLRAWLEDYFAGLNRQPDFRLAPQGTPFQKEVWQILLNIPYGQLTTYGAIAKELARQKGLPSMSAQAVGGAVGRNPISIIIPCHRVVGANRGLTGYAGGLEKKEALLKLEKADPDLWVN